MYDVVLILKSSNDLSELLWIHACVHCHPAWPLGWRTLLLVLRPSCLQFSLNTVNTLAIHLHQISPVSSLWTLLYAHWRLDLFSFTPLSLQSQQTNNIKLIILVHSLNNNHKQGTVWSGLNNYTLLIYLYTVKHSFNCSSIFTTQIPPKSPLKSVHYFQFLKL